MADALMRFYDSGLATDQTQHVSLRTCIDARTASDARIGLNVRVLSNQLMRDQSRLFGRYVCLCFPFLVRGPVAMHEKGQQQSGDAPCNKSFHISEVTQPYGIDYVDEGKHDERIT